MEEKNNQKIIKKKLNYDGGRLENVFNSLYKRGLVGSKKEFAEKVGSNISHLSTQMTSDRYTLNTVNKICKRFPQVSRSYLLSGEGTPLINAASGAMIINGDNNNHNTSSDNEVVLKALQIAEKAQALNEQANENLATLLQIVKNKKDINQ